MAYKKSDQIDEIAKALTKFQKAAPVIKKDKTANVGSYSYKYADLVSVWDAIRGALSDNGLSVIQSPTTQNGDLALTTLLIHGSGQYIEDTMPLKITQETPQGQGSAITYARRYMLSAMLGLVADDDNDAADHKTLTAIQKKQLFDTAKKVMPELEDDPLSMVRFLTEVVGKHPSRILADEFDDAIQSVETYTQQAVK
jgi:hypothetical protein